MDGGEARSRWVPVRVVLVGIEGGWSSVGSAALLVAATASSDEMEMARGRGLDMAMSSASFEEMEIGRSARCGACMLLFVEGAAHEMSVIQTEEI